MFDLIWLALWSIALIFLLRKEYKSYKEYKFGINIQENYRKMTITTSSIIFCALMVASALGLNL